MKSESETGPKREPDGDPRPETPIESETKPTRRRLLKLGAASLLGVVGAGVAGFELVDHDVIPGKLWLDYALGYCTVAQPQLTFVKPGPVYSGRFYSAARGRNVGYMISYPPGHARGDELPMAVFLHGFGGNHRSGIGGLTLAEVLAGQAHGKPLPPFALVSVDGGGGYWNPHPGDNPQAMIIDELLPLCRRRGLGRGQGRVGAMGVSMGGYGALLLAIKHPSLISAVAAVSPAVWTTFSEAHSANKGAYASAVDFARDDVVSHAAALGAMPVRVAAGVNDPFYPGVQALSRAAPRSVEFYFGPGCHTSSFFSQQQHPSAAFLGAHLTAA